MNLLSLSRMHIGFHAFKAIHLTCMLTLNTWLTQFSQQLSEERVIITVVQMRKQTLTWDKYHFQGHATGA